MRHAVCVVVHFALFVLDFHQTMDIGFKAGALLGKFAREQQVVHDLLVEDFTGNEQRNAGWVRRDQTR